MKKKLIFGLLAFLLGCLTVIAILANEKTLVFHPKGHIAEQEFKLIVTNIVLMLIIIAPTYFLLFTIFWKYCIEKKSPYDPNYKVGAFGQFLMWALPACVVIVMAVITWEATHRLNPYLPIQSENEAFKVEVVSLNWKWLFIYPDLGIATLNALTIPEKTPIHLNLTADNSPMNSFWIPQLSGQIYSMAGMRTQLYLIANDAREYMGREVEINGDGYADMTFKVKSMAEDDFHRWIEEVKQSKDHLTQEAYQELTHPFINRSVIYYSEVENELFKKILDKYMYPADSI